MPGRRVYVRTLERALRIIGSEEALAELLWVRPATLRHYLRGEATPADDVFLKAVDIVFNNAWGAFPVGRTRAAVAQAERRERVRDLVRDTAQLLSATDATLQAVRAMRAEGGALREAVKFKHRLFDPQFRPRDRQEVLDTGLDAALRAASTDGGDIELVDGGGALHIEAWRGLSDDFVRFCDGLRDRRSACELALAEQRQVVIADVTLHSLYAGTPLLERLRAADVRAVCATPLVSAAGESLGVVSTHFHEAKTPDEEQLAALQIVASSTSALLAPSRGSMFSASEDRP